MILTPTQRATLKTHIQANSDTNTLYVDGNLAGLTDLLNIEAVPAFWVWKPGVSRADIYNTQNDLVIAGAQTGFWNWTTYKNQSVTEQNAWVQMFMGDIANFALPNLRAGADAIFSGAGAPATQRAHIAAVAKRSATRAEKLFAAGAGVTASPSTMTFEGGVTDQDISAALALV